MKLTLASPLAGLLRKKEVPAKEDAKPFLTAGVQGRGPYLMWDKNGNECLYDPTGVWAGEAAKSFKEEFDNVFIKIMRWRGQKWGGRL